MKPDHEFAQDGIDEKEIRRRPGGNRHALGGQAHRHIVVALIKRNECQAGQAERNERRTHGGKKPQQRAASPRQWFLMCVSSQALSQARRESQNQLCAFHESGRGTC